MIKAVLLAAAIVASVTASDVMELSDSDFDVRLEDQEIALVMFYAPWCGHCKRLKPEFDTAAASLKSNDPPVTLAKIDCTDAGKDTCGRFKVGGYPTLKIFRDGELAEDYDGPRDSSGIVKYMASRAGPASKELKSAEEMKAFLEKQKDAVIMGFLEDTAELESFQKMAAKLRNTNVFGHSSKAIDGKKGIYLFRPKHLKSTFEEQEMKYDGAMSDKSKIISWIAKHHHGLVGHRSTENRADFKEPLVVAYYDVNYVKDPKGTNYWRNRVMKVAKDFKDDLKFAISSKDDFLAELNEYGVDGWVDKEPKVAIKSAKGKFVMTEKFSMDTFRAFLKAYIAGELEPYMKSEAVPESNDGPVKVAVAKNFNELVTESKKDVLIEFYAPWCGHCKSLAPKYDELGEKMAGEEVEIVKMDATANDVPPEFEVRGFPTIFWYPADTKKPESYNSGREVKDFIEFIAKKSTKGLNKYDKDGKEKKSEL